MPGFLNLNLNLQEFGLLEVLRGFLSSTLEIDKVILKGSLGTYVYSYSHSFSLNLRSRDLAVFINLHKFT